MLGESGVGKAPHVSAARNAHRSSSSSSSPSPCIECRKSATNFRSTMMPEISRMNRFQACRFPRKFRRGYVWMIALTAEKLEICSGSARSLLRGSVCGIVSRCTRPCTGRSLDSAGYLSRRRIDFNDKVRFIDLDRSNAVWINVERLLTLLLV